MKKILLLGSVAVVAVLSSCDSFLDDNRYPESTIAVNKDFWSKEINVTQEVNNFYGDYSGYGMSTWYVSASGGYLSDDQGGARIDMANWINTYVPASSTNWTAPYIQIRNANNIIEGVSSGSLAGTKVGDDFIAKARLHRARQYFLLVKRYGDVPLITKVLDPTDDAELYGPRTSRDVVMDFVLEDLNFAVANITTQKSATSFSSDLANAIKNEVCLFEGTYAKYQQGNSARAQAYLQAAVEAGEAIIARYPVNTKPEAYWALYNTLNTALASNPEVIFAKLYNQGVMMHSTSDYSNATDGVSGPTKDLFDSFLFLDGKPLASTSMDTTDEGVLEGNAQDGYSINISNLLAVRDQRLSYITYDHLFFDEMQWSAQNSSPMQSATGYGVKKFNNYGMTQSQLQTGGQNFISCPVYAVNRVMLSTAEAKAELGTLTDADVNAYLNPLFKRAGLPDQTVNGMSTINDPANNMGVSSLIWEIRRCRRCELVYDDALRYWDLIRWKQLDKLVVTTNPNVNLGANITPWLNALDANGNPNTRSNVNGYINVDVNNRGYRQSFEEKQYFYPVPNDQIGLNTSLNQNPGW
ncbi:MAG: RagB/SusD family nutrient uptake outer membrane protein [Muribaculaceae bacterium]|nr:RagB/SusD family nutrient uptake outer membrane protein [Muribaculaceae bacterium]